MKNASEEDHDMPIPITTTYDHSFDGHVNMNHHQHHHSANSAPSNPLLVLSSGNDLSKYHDHPRHHVGYNIMINNNKKEKPVVIKYKECLKNHAASMGGNATDGCGEFMPSGEESSIEALTCSACNCHRNFHRREIDGQEKTIFTPYIHHHPPPLQRKLMSHHHKMIMPVGVATGGSNSESEDLMEEDRGGSLTFRQPPTYNGHNQKKRFRTKFTQEQKEKMLSFADRVNWKIQRQEESVVQEFCQEIGVRRRVLRVWMHNNKHNHLSKKTNNVELASGNNEINKVTDGNLAYNP